MTYLLSPSMVVARVGVEPTFYTYGVFAYPIIFSRRTKKSKERKEVFSLATLPYGAAHEIRTHTFRLAGECDDNLSLSDLEKSIGEKAHIVSKTCYHYTNAAYVSYSYSPIYSGGSEGTRTPARLIKSQMLCR